MKGGKSHRNYITSRIPQGSNLGLLLFYYLPNCLEQVEALN